MSEGKRPAPKRRSPGSGPGAGGRRPVSGRGRKPVTGPEAASNTPNEDPQVSKWAGPESRAILAAVVCVLTLTIAGPVRTFFAQRAEQAQLAATEKALRSQIIDLQQQKDKQQDPAYIAAQARSRLGFVMPGDVPFQVQLPASAAVPARWCSRSRAATTPSP